MSILFARPGELQEAYQLVRNFEPNTPVCVRVFARLSRFAVSYVFAKAGVEI
jgi:hypothetical protein